MTFSAYARLAIWEFLLVCLISVALTYTLYDGFYIAPELQYSVIPAVIVVVVLVALYVVAFNRRTVRIGSVAFAIAAIAFLAVSIAVSDAPALEDAESNYFPFALVSLLTPTLCFLLARKRAGTAVLFVAGTFICSWIQFFYGRYELPWMLVFLTSALALVVFKNYQLSARTAQSVGKLSFSAGFGVAAATVAIAVGLGSAVWFGIVAPLGPDAMEIKLITEVRALETVPVQGSSDEFLTPRMDLTSDKTNADERTTDDLKQGEDGRPEPARPLDDTKVEEEQSGSLMGLDLDSVVEAFDFESDPPRAWFSLSLVMLIPLAIIAYFVGRRLLRSRRLKKLGSLDPAAQVGALYYFLVDRLAKVGFPMPSGATVLEFARNNAGSMERMDMVAGESFASLTDVFTHVSYGKGQPTDEQLEQFRRYYRGFWKAARKQLGNVSYFFKSFRL